MSNDEYLLQILHREFVDTGSNSPILKAAAGLSPVLDYWAGDSLLGAHRSGSFAKGTANNSSTDIDVFLSLKSTTSNNLEEIYRTLCNALHYFGYSYREQNVSIGTTVAGYKVDLVPARRQSQYGNDHSLYLRKRDTWTKTNIQSHISLVSNSGRCSEIRLLKLWRDQWGLDFPSIYLELSVITALYNQRYGALSDNFVIALRYFRDRLPSEMVVDPANGSNIISNDTTATNKSAIAAAAARALNLGWNEVIR